MCDQVAVIREGRIDEYGPPLALLENPNGAFSTLVNELGDEGAARKQWDQCIAIAPNSRQAATAKAQLAALAASAPPSAEPQSR